MKKRLKKKFALSDQGAKDMLTAILAVTASNLALMFPVSLLYLFTGDYLSGTRRSGFYWAGIAVCLALILLTTIWQYNATFFATYIESGARRIRLAEKLRKLPLSFFAKRDLADLTSTIMADSEALEHAGSHQIPQYYGSIVSTVIVCAGLFFFQWKMALAAVWPVPAALLIVLTSKNVQNRFSRRQVEAKIDLNEGVQEFIETSRDLKSNNAENSYAAGLFQKIDTLEKRAIGAELGTALFVVTAQMLLKFGIATVALTGSVLLLSGELSLMQFFCFLLVASRLYEPMAGTLVNLGAINALQVNVDRMNRIADTKEQTGSETFTPDGYDVAFEHAGFSYEDGKKILSDVSFTARQGEVTALVGPSGGGKTTTSRLAARFWDTDTGRVGTIDTAGRNEKIYSKAVRVRIGTKLEIRGKAPDQKEDMPESCVLYSTAVIAPGAEAHFYVCNNGLDASPAWEETIPGEIHTFVNEAKTADSWALNWKITVDAGTATGEIKIGPQIALGVV